MKILSFTMKSITPYVAISVLFRLFVSVAVVSMVKFIPQILQTAEDFVPSNLKYPFT